MFWWTARRLEKKLKSDYDFGRKDAFLELSGLRGVHAVKFLARYAEDSGRPRVQSEAIKALGNRQDDASIFVLIRLLEDEHAPIKIRKDAAYALREHAKWETGEAAWALRGAGKSAAVEPLIRASDHPELLHVVAGTLVSIGDPRAVPVLIRWLGVASVRAADGLDKLEPDWRKRRETADVVRLLIDSLVKYGQSAVLSLDKIDSNWRNSAAAQAAIPVVLEALVTHGRRENRNPRVVENAANAIAAIGGSGNEQAITLLKKAYLDPADRSWRRDENISMESALTNALEKLGADYISPESREAEQLLNKLTTPSLRYTAEQANTIDELQRLLEKNVSVISSNCLRKIAALKREVIRFTLHTTRDDEPYIVPGEVNTGPCVDKASGALSGRDNPNAFY
jgi:HEAT repeat protein